MQYQLIRSQRKTISIRIEKDATVTVRAPFFASLKRIEAFLSEKEAWILKTQARILAQIEEVKQQGNLLSAEEIDALKKQAKKEFAPLLSYYASIVGVHPTHLSVRCQKTRWGSCTKEGHISLNCLLLLAPDDVRDSVIVHELCHMKQMNHSKAFYLECRKAFPQYDEADRWLKKHGSEIMQRVDGR